ncbi:MAG: DEAD/DEAH box helicase [Actinobacteria bacterium]|nr:DEAD/DEAH box helicase [Actinomycetota bacterium]
MALEGFAEPTAAWFRTTFGEATDAQVRAWPAIRSNEHVLLCAPTGSGKTLAAFLAAIDELAASPIELDAKGKPIERTSVLYISPLRALAVDVEKNLRAPIRGIRLAAERLGQRFREPTVGVRTGDSSVAERRALVSHPPDILITTPESLYLLLTSAARDTLRSVTTVIIDEIHAMAATKRGSHLALSLERLADLADRDPQRIGLSATQRPLAEVAHFLGGNSVEASTGEVRGARPVTIVDAGIRKTLDLQVIVPIEDMARLGEPLTTAAEQHGDVSVSAGPQRRSIWPSVHSSLLDLVEQHRSTIIFCNARRLSERLASRLNELAEERAGGDQASALGAESMGTSKRTGDELVRAHHGSLSREQRLIIEDQLKSGTLRGLVATSSLELGIDMGSVDLVVQVESPGSVASGLQRVGRAGHQVGVASRGRFFPKHRADLLETAVVVQRMEAGEIESTRYIRNPLDVLAQQLVAMVALDERSLDDIRRIVRSSAPFGELSDELLFATLDLLDGRYPSDEFAELAPRIVWDRSAGLVRGRSGTQRLAVTNAGTIPDRGLFGVFLPDGTRVGELDEEMVYESRVGETFLLGATTWRIEDITMERVVVVPAPGVPGKMPFWHGDGPGRPAELGEAVGAFTRTIRQLPRGQALDRLRGEHHLDELAAENLLAYLDEQAEATSAVPDDRTIVVERFRDEIGDWRICVLTPFGAQVHAPWGMAIRKRLETAGAGDVEIMWSDDGIIFRLPDAEDSFEIDDLLLDPDEVTDVVVEMLPSSAMFAARFREAAARALLLPRRRVDRRTPLWQQRQRAGSLLAVAAKYPTFPILLETTRECINDVFDLPALVELMRKVQSREIRIVSVDTQVASPFAASLLYSWVAQYMYEGDAPLAERRAAALGLDRSLLRELLGSEELRSLLDADVIAAVEADLQRLSEHRRARDVDELHDLLRVLGPLDRDELVERVSSEGVLAEAGAVNAALVELVERRRSIEVTVGGRSCFADAADAGRLRDALGVNVPPGLPAAFTESHDAPLRSLAERYARTHGPFTTAQFGTRFGITHESAAMVLAALAASGSLLAGEFRPGGRGSEWCDPDVLRTIRRRTLAALRREVEAVEPDVLGRFLPAWQGVGRHDRGADAVAGAVSQLAGVPLVASTLDRDVLALRVEGYRAADLDDLCTRGEIVWIGAGSIGSRDGRLRLVFRNDRALIASAVAGLDETTLPDGEMHEALRDILTRRGACFWADLAGECVRKGLPYDDATMGEALWDLVWSGEVTNDSFAPLRVAVAKGRRAGPQRKSVRGIRALAPVPPRGVGRWSMVRSLVPDEVSRTEIGHAVALQLLDRYGVLTREMALSEGIESGFAGVYPVLKAMEEQGQIRRGYFVAGLGAAQFATHAAVDRLRSFRTDTLDQHPDGARREPTVVTLVATDPAQPYGAVLPWPDNAGRPARAAGARVVLVDGEAAAWIDRAGRNIITFATGADDEAVWVNELVRLVADRRVERFELATIDGQPAVQSRWAEILRSSGFVDGYRGLVLRGR